MFIDVISSSNMPNYTHNHPTSSYKLTNGKKTKTYGLVGLGAPFRQGRSLSLPTLPFQKTNRYAVVGAMQMPFYSKLASITPIDTR